MRCNAYIKQFYFPQTTTNMLTRHALARLRAVALLACLLACALLPQAYALTNQVSGPLKRFASIASVGQKLFNNTCSSCEVAISLPKPLQFGSRTVTSILVSTNGVISLDTGVAAGWSAGMTQITAGSSAVPRVALIQTTLLEYGNTSIVSEIICVLYVCVCVCVCVCISSLTLLSPKSGIYYLCDATSCTISYEDAVFGTNINGPVSAQVEMYAGGEVELRYGSQPQSSNMFVSGIQDDVQGVNAPSLFAGCNATGMCATDLLVSFPANQGLRLSCE